LVAAGFGMNSGAGLVGGEAVREGKEGSGDIIYNPILFGLRL